MAPGARVPGGSGISPKRPAAARSAAAFVLEPLVGFRGDAAWKWDCDKGHEGLWASFLRVCARKADGCAALRASGKSREKDE